MAIGWTTRSSGPANSSDVPIAQGPLALHQIELTTDSSDGKKIR
jgi:hypothetical protein